MSPPSHTPTKVVGWGCLPITLSLEANPFECFIRVHWNSECGASDSWMEDLKGGAGKRGQLWGFAGGKEG